MSALAHGASLEYLQLNTLKIDNTCAPSLVAMARALKRLRVLSLEGNRLSESGLLVLAKGLAGHPCLSELHLADQHTPISVKAVDSLIEMIEQVRLARPFSGDHARTLAPLCSVRVHTTRSLSGGTLTRGADHPSALRVIPPSIRLMPCIPLGRRRQR